MSSTVFDGIGGVRTTLGAQPIFRLTSFRRAPCFPITSPGERASIWTSPVSSSKKMFVIWASFGMSSRIAVSASSCFINTDGSGRTWIRRRRFWASWRTISLLSAKASMFFV